MTSTSSRVADRYRLVGELGRGGMGVVWEAYDELLHRSVALKEVHFPPELPAEDRARLAGRTLQEARAVAALDTPAAVRVYDIVEQDGRPWLVMELLRGTTLSAEVAAGGPLPEHEVARVGLALTEALEAAHAAGVLHRDVKPSNVLLGSEGRVALTDFGIATIEGDSGDATTGVVLGSPSYIAPERAAGHRPTAASDLWALGATLWTALEGRPPYEGPTALAVMNAVSTSDAPLASRCSPALRDLLARLLARDPAQRPTTGEVRDVLTGSAERPATVDPTPTAALPLDAHFDRTTVLDAGPVAPTVAPPAAPPPRVPVPVRRRSRRPLLVAAAALVVLLAGGLGLLLSGGGDSSRTGATPRATAAPTASAPATERPSAAAQPAAGGLHQVSGDGWTLDVPDGWTRTTTDAGTRYSDPAGGRYLLVATRDPAGPSAVGAWRDQEKSMRARHADYQRVRLEGDKATADWEFTYSDGGAALHALDRAWVTGGVGYAVFVQSHADAWDASRPLFDQVLDSFRT